MLNLDQALTAQKSHARACRGLKLVLCFPYILLKNFVPGPNSQHLVQKQSDVKGTISGHRFSASHRSVPSD